MRDAILEHCDAFIEILQEFTDDQVDLIDLFAEFFSQHEILIDMFNPLLQHLNHKVMFIEKEGVLGWVEMVE